MPSAKSDRATSSAHEWKDKMGSWTSSLSLSLLEFSLSPSLSLSQINVYLFSLPVRHLVQYLAPFFFY